MGEIFQGKSDNTKVINYSKKEVQKAGEFLIQKDINESNIDEYLKAIGILSWWRSLHIYPLNMTFEELRYSALKVDKNALVAKRLKRTPSIIDKLKRFNSMKLRNMQDIAGCRVVVSTKNKAYKLKRELSNSRKYKVVDYIEKPKEDGYRSIHLIGKYPDKDNKEMYPIEIQIRTITQHAWATGVEIIDLFTNQSLKSNQGEKDWHDFFRNVSSEFSKLDGNDTKDESSEAESYRLAKKLDVQRIFEAFRHSLKFIEPNIDPSSQDGYYLFDIDLKKKQLVINFYSNHQLDDATRNYLEKETDAVKKQSMVVALVSTNSIKNIKEAYPNYFADSTVFLEKLDVILKQHKRKNPNWLTRFIFSPGKLEANA